MYKPKKNGGTEKGGLSYERRLKESRSLNPLKKEDWEGVKLVWWKIRGNPGSGNPQKGLKHSPPFPRGGWWAAGTLQPGRKKKGLVSNDS